LGDISVKKVHIVYTVLSTLIALVALAGLVIIGEEASGNAPGAFLLGTLIAGFVAAFCFYFSTDAKVAIGLVVTPVVQLSGFIGLLVVPFNLGHLAALVLVASPLLLVGAIRLHDRFDVRKIERGATCWPT
jgi:hypothetical protein